VGYEVIQKKTTPVDRATANLPTPNTIKPLSSGLLLKKNYNSVSTNTTKIII
jgi:hypothetical protein